MYNIEEILNQTFAGNSVKNILIFLGSSLILLLIFRIFRRVFIHRLKKQKTNIKKKEEEAKRGMIKSILVAVENVHRVFYIAIALYFPSKFLVVPHAVERWIDAVFMVIIIVEAIRAAHIFVDYFIQEILLKRKKNTGKTESAFMGMKLVANILLWTIGVLLVLSNIGINITSLVAGLGIGGIAIALAVQNILGDVLSSFSIYFDKPFEIGDFIIVGEDMGVVKKVGIKTTRLESLQGEEIVISNKELTSIRIQNFKKMRKRRVLLNFGLVYGTKVKQLKKANEIVEKVVSKTPDVEFARCHFTEFGDFSLRFEVVYFVSSGDFNVFRDKQEEVNLGIKEKFEEEGIQMAFPTQTIHLEK